MIMSLKQKEMKFKPRLKLNNNTHMGKKICSTPKVAQPKVAAGGGGGGGIILKFRVSDFQHFPQHIFSKLI